MIVASDKICVHCGSEYQGPNASRYCSPGCKRAAAARRAAPGFVAMLADCHRNQRVYEITADDDHERPIAAVVPWRRWQRMNRELAVLAEADRTS